MDRRKGRHPPNTQARLRERGTDHLTYYPSHVLLHISIPEGAFLPSPHSRPPLLSTPLFLTVLPQWLVLEAVSNRQLHLLQAVREMGGVSEKEGVPQDIQEGGSGREGGERPTEGRKALNCIGPLPSLVPPLAAPAHPRFMAER